MHDLNGDSMKMHVTHACSLYLYRIYDYCVTIFELYTVFRGHKHSQSKFDPNIRNYFTIKTRWGKGYLTFVSTSEYFVF